MQPMNLHFDIRDLFKAPRLGLGGKKIWILLQVNLIGYLIYFILTYLSLLFNGWNLKEIWDQFGLYPYLLTAEFSVFSLILWIIGSIAWTISISLGMTAVARITYKQLKGDGFYSSSDAFNYVKKHWHAPVFTPISILIILFIFVFMAILFALVGKIPFVGELFVGIPYLIWFVGSIFVAYTSIVLFVSIFFTNSIVATMEEDTMGSVFHNYSITWSQPWRIILYLPIIFSLVYFSTCLLAYVSDIAFQLINIVFGHDMLMGSKLGRMMQWSNNIVFDPLIALFSPLAPFEGLLNSYYLPDTSNLMGTMEHIGSTFISLSLFIITIIIFSYSLSVAIVGQTITIIIFRMKTEKDNLLERKDEEELELENEDDWSFDSDNNIKNEETEIIE